MIKLIIFLTINENQYLSSLNQRFCYQLILLRGLYESINPIIRRVFESTLTNKRLLLLWYRQTESILECNLKDPPNDI